MMFGSSGSEGDIWLDEHYTLHVKEGVTVQDIIPKEVAALSDQHWLDFRPMHPFIVDVIGILFALLSLINIIGNGTSIFLFIKDPDLRKPSNMLVVNLAISDIIMLLTNGLPLAYNVFQANYWIFGKTACTLYGLAGGITGLCSLWTLVFIGYDRNNVIVNGLKARPFTISKAALAILFCWGYPVLLLIWPTLEIWSSWRLEGLLMSCSFDYLTDTWQNMLFTMFIFVGCFVVPVCFVMYFYLFIVKAVWAHESEMKNQAKKMGVDNLRQNGDKAKESAEMKIAKVAITNVLIWYCTWTPYAMVVLIGQFGGKHLLTPLVSQFPSMLAKTCSCFNPIIYALSHPQFRAAMRKYLWCGSKTDANAPLAGNGVSTIVSKGD